MVATGTALTLIGISLLAIAALTIASIYMLPPLIEPLEEEGRGHA